MIKWAPLNVPLRRRLQTLSIFIYVFLATYGFFVNHILFVVLLWTRLWWLDVIYILYALHDNGMVAFYGNSRSDWFRSWRIWKYCVEYFPIKLIKTVDLDPSKNYLGLTYPHGLLMISQWFVTSSTASGFKEKFPGLTPHLATVGARFGTPFGRELALKGGACTVAEECLLYLLDQYKHKGNFVMMNTGGSSEVMVNRKDAYNLYLKRRRGFARVALKTGVSIVPIFCFGENKLFDGVIHPPDTFLGKFQRKFREITMVVPIPPIGRGFFQYSFGMIPHRVPINVVVGSPLEVPKVENPTKAQIDEVYERLVQAVKDLFNEHKHRYEPDPNIPLNIL